MNKFFPNEDKMELATRMTLLINGIEMVDEYSVGEDMACKTTGQDLYPNKITIKIEGRDPPTMTPEERAKLAKECKEADFRVPNKDNDTKEEIRIAPPYPCVYVTPGKSGGGHQGLPILALSGKNPPLVLLSSNHQLTG